MMATFIPVSVFWIWHLYRLRDFQLLTSACRYCHFWSRKVEATRRTTRDDPKLAY
jgi:hypothetical protein